MVLFSRYAGARIVLVAKDSGPASAAKEAAAGTPNRAMGYMIVKGKTPFFPFT